MWNIGTTILFILVVMIAIALVGARLAGLKAFSVLSGSMEPNYSTGSLIYTKEVDNATLEVGDVITFMLDDKTVATHRIVEVIPDETDSSIMKFRTKGDANDTVDGALVHYKNVIGSPIFCIPKMGYVATYITSSSGMYVVISLGIIALLLTFIPDLWSDGKTEQIEIVENRRS